jgi:hypothetical protein
MDSVKAEARRRNVELVTVPTERAIDLLAADAKDTKRDPSRHLLRCNPLRAAQARFSFCSCRSSALSVDRSRGQARRLP